MAYYYLYYLGLNVKSYVQNVNRKSSFSTRDRSFGKTKIQQNEFFIFCFYYSKSGYGFW